MVAPHRLAKIEGIVKVQRSCLAVAAKQQRLLLNHLKAVINQLAVVVVAYNHVTTKIAILSCCGLTNRY